MVPGYDHVSVGKTPHEKVTQRGGVPIMRGVGKASTNARKREAGSPDGMGGGQETADASNRWEGDDCFRYPKVVYRESSYTHS